MDFVHDTLADGRPCRVLTVVDYWSWQSPVLEVGGWMTGETVSQILDRGQSEGPHPRPITVDMRLHSNRRRWKSGPIGEVSSPTSFVPANRLKTPPLSYAPLDEIFQ